MNIREIKIENVRGISSKTILLDMHPNKVTFFVAPNGFGKTSIARAFGSLKREKIELAEEGWHKGDGSAQPLIELTTDGGTIYRADSSSNAIFEEFGVHVISSQVRPKATTRNFGQYTASSAPLIVNLVVLVNTYLIKGTRIFFYFHKGIPWTVKKKTGS